MKKIVLFLLMLTFAQIAFAQTKIDEYGKLNTDDESARLFNFVTQARAEAGTKGLIIVYKPKNWETGRFLRHFYGIKRYVGFFNFTNFEMVAGEERDEILHHLYLIEDDGKMPDYKSISLDNKIREKVVVKTLFDSECIDCSPAVPLNLYIFNEGLDYYAEALKANPNSEALMVIGEVADISKTRREKRELIKKINEILVENNQVAEKRIKIRFRNSMNAYLYIVPNELKK